MSVKGILIIAGPNGAGKTTFAREFLPREADCPNFINADLIAAGLSPFAPELADRKAARLMLQEMESLAAKGESFGFETTLAGVAYAHRIVNWRAQGYRVTIFYLTLPSPDMAIARVAQRVRQGGHGVPEEVIRRRFRKGWSNFDKIYRPLVDEWAIYDSSGPEPGLIDWSEKI